MKKPNESYHTTLEKTIIKVVGIPEGEKRKKRTENLFNKIIAENLPNLGKELDIQVHKINRTPYHLNTKRPSLE